MRWLPDAGGGATATRAAEPMPDDLEDGERPTRILLADDNADMRE